MKTTIYKIVKRKSLNSIGKHLLNHFQEELLQNGWISFQASDLDTIEISTNFLTEIAENIFEINRENSSSEESMDALEQLNLQLTLLRNLISPAKKAIFVDQAGLIDVGRSKIKVNLLDNASDMSTGNPILTSEELANLNLDPLLFASAFDIIENSRTTLSQLRILKKLKVLQKFDELCETHLKLSTGVERLNVAGVTKIFPMIKEKPFSNGGLFEVSAKIIDEDSNEHDIQAKHINLKEQVVKIGTNTYLPIEANVGNVFENIKTNEILLKSDVISHIADPVNIFGEGFDPEIVDLSQYSSRVLGFEEIKADKIIEGSSGIEWFKSDDDKLFFTARNAQGENVSVVVSNSTDLRLAAAEIEKKLSEHDQSKPISTVEIEGYSIPVTQSILDKINDVCVELYGDEEAEPSKTREAGKRKAAIIRESDAKAQAIEVLRYSQFTKEEIWKVVKDDKTLDPHQVDGVSWLMAHFKKQFGGVLLADDMGLGKTLQIMTFIALAASDEKLKVGEKFNKPVLIVAPKILLENWVSESKVFIKSDFFKNNLIFHDKNIQGFIKDDGSLNLKALCTYNVIITTYTTFASYQQSLLKIPFSIAVFDESQWIKNPGTATARAARGLHDSFVICCTGTPVENSYLDLWSQIDVGNRKPNNPLGPKGNYLGGLSGSVDIGQVKELLGYPNEGGIVKRREKTILPNFPKKVIHPPITVEMTDFQQKKQREIVSVFGKSQLKVIQKLQALYQHPLLLEISDPAELLAIDAETLINYSPKLQKTLELISEIKEKKEKVLIFVLWTQMQLILQKVIQAKFGIKPDIINGKSNANLKGEQAAQNVISRFGAVGDFNVLILSPLAAGAGLNITAANHVIHYGRWWNPAKEDQATDRAYRKGQKKTVHVYYPTLTKSDASDNFDLNLARLVEQKRELATDFLDLRLSSEISGSDFSDILKGRGTK